METLEQQIDTTVRSRVCVRDSRLAEAETNNVSNEKNQSRVLGAATDPEGVFELPRWTGARSPLQHVIIRTRPLDSMRVAVNALFQVNLILVERMIYPGGQRVEDEASKIHHVMRFRLIFFASSVLVRDGQEWLTTLWTIFRTLLQGNFFHVRLSVDCAVEGARPHGQRLPTRSECSVTRFWHNYANYRSWHDEMCSTLQSWPVENPLSKSTKIGPTLL